MDEDVLEALPGLLGELGIESDVPRLRVAASPLGLHALKKVTGHLDTQLRLPPTDKFGYGIVQEGFAPFMHDRLTLRPAAAGAHDEHDPAVAEAYGGLGVFFSDGEQIAPSPEVVALTVQKFTRRFSCLIPEMLLLLFNPYQLRDYKGAKCIQAHA